ncbi:MAG: hypothetical protein AAGA48_07685 [Myxococcota bacterium]
MIASFLFAGLAAAQTTPPSKSEQSIELLERDAEADPHPSHVILPDPLERPENQLEAERQKAKVTSPAPVRVRPSNEPSVPPRIARKAPRPVRGTAPAHLHGRYYVAEVTEGGLTEDYRNKMERAGRALDEDCIVTRTRFDFGDLPASPGVLHRPRTVAITRIQQCQVGGLGKYAEELTTVLDVAYTEGDDVVTLTLPAAKVISDYVRLRRPSDGDMPTPPQWLAPATTVDQAAQRWLLVAEPAARGALPVLHLTSENLVWHLEPDRGDSPFDIADRAANGGYRRGTEGAP